MLCSASFADAKQAYFYECSLYKLRTYNDHCSGVFVDLVSQGLQLKHTKWNKIGGAELNIFKWILKHSFRFFSTLNINTVIPFRQSHSVTHNGNVAYFMNYTLLRTYFTLHYFSTFVLVYVYFSLNYTNILLLTFQN